MKKLFSFLSKEVVRISIGAAFFVAALIVQHGFAKDIPALVLYVISLAVTGVAVYIDAVRGIIRLDLLDEKFLMSVASIGAMIVGEWSEGCAVMLFFLIGETFEHFAVKRSRAKIRALMSICPDEATVIRGGEEETVDADEVEVGETLIVRNGERIAADARITSGEAELDTSLMTGEALPRRITVGSEVNSGSILIGGPVTAVVIRVAEDSGAQRILAMVEEANERKSREEAFITSFSKIYTPIVVGLALLLAFLPPIFRLMPLSESVYRALIFLVISCPCALVISVPMAFFGGIGAAASRGILFKGGTSFAPVARATAFAFDKTGTLTSGDFSIKGVAYADMPEDELLALAAAVEYGSDHPIARPFRKYFDGTAAEGITEISGRGTTGTVGGNRVAVGNIALATGEGALVPKELEYSLDTLVYVVRAGKLVGAVSIGDEVKPEAKAAISELYSLGVKKTVILSGDRQDRAQRIGSELGISEVYGELLPEDKYKKLEELSSSTVAYVGDGINDAPALTLADVGIAMGGVGSDTAKESADVVLVSDELTRIPEAVRIAKRTLRIAKENIVFALGVKLSILVLGAFGIAGMWLAVFADVGVAVLAILNSMRTLITERRK